MYIAYIQPTNFIRKELMAVISMSLKSKFTVTFDVIVVYITMYLVSKSPSLYFDFYYILSTA